MKFSTALSIFGTFVAVSAQQDISAEPACALPCLQKAIDAAGCGITDQACQCSAVGKAAIQQAATPCLVSSCSGEDLAKAASIGNGLCAAWSQTALGPSPTGNPGGPINNSTTVAPTATGTGTGTVNPTYGAQTNTNLNGTALPTASPTVSKTNTNTNTHTNTATASATASKTASGNAAPTLAPQMIGGLMAAVVGAVALL